MQIKIGVEENLTPFKEYLSNKGYSVETINFDEDSSSNLKTYDAIVMTGLNTNFMGMTDRETKAIVIDAAGLTPDQVYTQLKSKFH